MMTPFCGEMSERLKEHAWKACVTRKRTVGSNPTLSDRKKIHKKKVTFYTELDFLYNTEFVD